MPIFYLVLINKMEKITRHLKRERKSGFIQTFPFTTYSIILNENRWPEDEKTKAFYKYLQTSFLSGFKGCEKSPSSMPEIFIEVKEVIKNEYTNLAKQANYRGFERKQHGLVQDKFLAYHSGCIAVEAPVNDSVVEGCIDILLFQPDPFKITILDFKPYAAREKKAATQMYYYLKALMFQTGINRKYFDVYYFDDTDCFEVLLNQFTP